MSEVFFLTLSAVGTMMLYVGIGYFLRRRNHLPEEAGKVLSLLTTLLFSPAYSIINLPESVTSDVLMDKLAILGYGVVFVIVAYGVGFLLSRPFGRTPEEKRSLIYAFSTPNYGYFGYPVIEAVFGKAVLADVLIFCIPLGLVTTSFALTLFMKGQKIQWRKMLLSPMLLGTVIGVILGVTGLRLPDILQSTLKGLGGCMSISSMLLAGMMLAKFPLKKLLTGWRPYYLSLVRLVGIPVLFGVVLWFSGLRGNFLMMPMLLVGLPLGLNLVVYPESQGQEQLATDNAKVCFISYLLAIVLLPCTFAVLDILLK